jgi:hypothetical protein
MVLGNQVSGRRRRRRRRKETDPGTSTAVIQNGKNEKTWLEISTSTNSRETSELNQRVFWSPW